MRDDESLSNRDYLPRKLENDIDPTTKFWTAASTSQLSQPERSFISTIHTGSVSNQTGIDDITTENDREPHSTDYYLRCFPPLPRELTRISMGDSFAGRTYKNAQRFLHRVTKAVMRSHHFRIPIYDMPIRLRPVRHSSFPTFSLTVNGFWAVVYRFHIHRHAGLGFPRVHKLLPLPTAK